MDTEHEENSNVIQSQTTNDEGLDKVIKSARPRLAELYVKQAGNNYVTTKTSGKLRIYELNSNNVQTDEQKKRKVIILVGETGHGKSTLVNGMANYIMGVKWEDPFRFDVTQKESAANARSQAFSQTQFIDVYNFQHEEGMAIPYSVTIIDTPGYGDRSGATRDKKISTYIKQYLNEFRSQFDYINAVCFVAVSGRSHLSSTQHHILGDVFSIFDDNVKNSIRLLVTFSSDNDSPLIDKACAALFPVPSDSGDILRFNSSISLDNEAYDDFTMVNKCYWDMDQENYKRFFDMLENMEACGWKQSDELEASRRMSQIGNFMDSELENKLEPDLVELENVEILRRFLATSAELAPMSKKHFKVEKTEMQTIKVPSVDVLWSYNCEVCKATCQRHIDDGNLERFLGSTDTAICIATACTCKASSHHCEQFEWVRRSVRVATTLRNMRDEYENQRCKTNQKMTDKELESECIVHLNEIRAKVFQVLQQIANSDNRSAADEASKSYSWQSKAIDYIDQLKENVSKKQQVGFVTRLDTLEELRRSLVDDKTSEQKSMSTVTHYEATPAQEESVENEVELRVVSGRKTEVKAQPMEKKLPEKIGKNQMNIEDNVSIENFTAVSSAGELEISVVKTQPATTTDSTAIYERYSASLTESIMPAAIEEIRELGLESIPTQQAASTNSVQQFGTELDDSDNDMSCAQKFWRFLTCRCCC